MSDSLRHALVALLLAAVWVCGMPLWAGEVPERGARVYLLRMNGGFDLHLANRLTETGLMTVVTDPLAADFVLTEGVGAGFEERMKELFPPPIDQSEETADRDEESGTEAKGGEFGIKRLAPPRATSFGRSSGTVFLVRRVDSIVVWSTFLERRDTRESAMHKSAGDVVKRLKKWFDADAKARAEQVPQ